MTLIRQLSYENIAYMLIEKIKKYKTVLIASAISAILSYMFLFTNKLVNHDDIKALFDLGVGLSSGRWMIDVMAKLTITASLPWLNGIVSIILISAANCFITEMFEIKKPVIQAVLAFLIIAFPGQMDVFTYMFTATAYSLAFLFSVISAFLFRKGGKLEILFGICFGVAMLATYQAYLAVTATILLLLMVNDLLAKKEASAVLKNGLKSIAYLLALVVCYLASTALLMFVSGNALNSYATGYVNDQALIERVLLTYKHFFGLVTGKELNLVSTVYSAGVHIAIMLIVLVQMLAEIIRSGSKGRSALLLLCLVLMPLSMNSVVFVFRVEGVREMMSFGFIGIYILVAMLLENSDWNKKKLVREALLWLLTLVIINNVCVLNKTALRMHLAYENTYSFYTTVLADIKMTPGFDEDCGVALIGYSDVHVYPIKELGDDNVHGALKDLINVYSREAFIRYFCGFDAHFADEAECAEIMETQEFKDMPRYPYYGSIQRIGDFVVVKLDEIPLA